MKIVIKTILLVELVHSNWKNVMGVKEKYTVGELGLTLLIWVIGHQRYHHAWKLGIAFEKKHWQCCDLFQIHKKRVKGGHKISFDLACKLQQKSFNCVPGLQLCHNCYRRVIPCMTREETMVVSDNNDFSKCQNLILILGQ